MMRILISVLIIILLVSCTEKVEESKPLIEIYELNKWVESYESQPLDSSMIADFQKYEMDTTRYRYSEEYGLLINGGFIATTEDLKNDPLIENSLILGYDFKKDVIIIDSLARHKIYPNTRFTKARQLAMTIDKKVILSFYERTNFSSYEIGNTVFFDGINKNFTDETINYSSYLNLARGPFKDNDWWGKDLNLKQDTTFYNAFKRAGKIIAE